MKKILFLFVCIFIGTQLFAISPYSLENLTSVNVKIFDKKKLLDIKSYEALDKKVKKTLQEAGIKVDSENFANFLITISTFLLQDQKLVHVRLFLVEDVSIKRDKITKAIATTYSKEDFFESTLLNEDIDESVTFLIDEFITQYKEEN
ncbi:MAG: hypothetical protein IBX44_00135 [Sulfurospirillum sp.]|nr:hypothetical protein [Sulfurospirillum sp.]